MRNEMKFVCVTGLVLLLGLGVVNADDRDLLKASGAPPHVLLILDSGASMSLNGETNSINYLAGADDQGGRYTQDMLKWYEQTYAGPSPANIPGPEALEYPPSVLESDFGYTRDEADRWGLALGPDPLGHFELDDDGNPIFVKGPLEIALDQGAKLPQAKRALSTLMDSDFGFNWGFSYYQKSNIEIRYLNYIYRVVDIYDQSGSQPMLYDGTELGTPLRFGAQENQQGSASPPPMFPIQYGANGDEATVLNWDPRGLNTGTPDSPDNHDIRFASFLVNPFASHVLDPWAFESLGETLESVRKANHLYYSPAYDFDALTNSNTKDALQGLKTWEEWAVLESIPLTDADWKQQVNEKLLGSDTVVGEFEAVEIGSTTLLIMEGYQEYNNIHHGWDVIPPPAGLLAPRYARVEFEQEFVLYDYSMLDEGANNFSNTPTSQSWQGESTCVGYLDSGNSIPIVPLSRPDPADNGEVADQTSLIKTYLGHQYNPVYYFPGQANPAGYPYWPEVRENFIPLTESIAAGGRRPIKDTIVEAGQYFGQEVETWTDDPLAVCRMRFLIIITDGAESCSNTEAPCNAATNIARNNDVAVYMIYFGSENNKVATDQNVIECVGTNSGGDSYLARNEEELMAALLDIGRDIEERTRGFASPIVPSVETTTKQMAYISTFTPFQERSIYRGHLRAYPIDPVSGVIANLRGASPDPDASLWDAGDALAARWDWGDGDEHVTNPWRSGDVDSRKMYYGVDLSGTPTRRLFQYPGDRQDAADFDLRKEIGAEMYGEWWTLAYDSTLVQWDPTSGTPHPPREQWADVVKLHNAIDFMRGVRFGIDETDPTIPKGLRDMMYDAPEPPSTDPVPIPSSSYHWCGTAGNVDPDDPDVPDAATCAEGEEPTGIEKLGDIFHSVPQRMAAPACFACYLSNYNSYQTFLTTHRHRRTVLFAGSNDGTMHAFDAGLWDIDGIVADDVPPQYDAGTGRELFAWVPRSVMHAFPGIATTQIQDWAVDGTSTVADVWIGDQWRTLLLWGQRRGGNSYVALDITQPDTYDADGEPNRTGEVAFEDRLSQVQDEFGDWHDVEGTEWPALTADNLLGGDLALRDPMLTGWPAFKWEFSDPSDEDSNGADDLGQTWSRPLVGFVKVDTGSGAEDRMVAFFGGGYTPSARGVFADQGISPPGFSGNFIYGLDVETGEILYKEAIDGMVPGNVAGLDLDLDGFLEKLYFGTTNGNIYRVPLGVVGSVTGGRVLSDWDPELIFDAPEEPVLQLDGTIRTWHQNFFMSPTLVPISFNADGSAQLVIAIGSGNRDGIFQKNPQPHRFYVFKEPAVGAPALTELGLQPLDLNSDLQTSENYLASDTVEGWYLELYDTTSLKNWEKVNTNALVLSDNVIFSTFNPVSEIAPVELLQDDGSSFSPQRWLCRRGGSARTYVVSLSNANAVPGNERYFQYDEETAMVTDPVVYLGADGEIHVIQASDDLQIHEPIASFAAPVRMVNWREE